MTDHAAKQREYEAKRHEATNNKHVIVKPLRKIGEVVEEGLSLTVRADMLDDVRERLAAAGYEFADEPSRVGSFW